MRSKIGRETREKVIERGEENERERAEEVKGINKGRGEKNWLGRRKK